jgi:hypothetical protein
MGARAAGNLHDRSINPGRFEVNQANPFHAFAAGDE